MSDALKFLKTSSIIFFRTSIHFSREPLMYSMSSEDLQTQIPWNISHTQKALVLDVEYRNFNIKRAIYYNDSNHWQPFEVFRIIVHNNDEFPSYSGYQTFHMKDYPFKIRIVPEINLIDDDVKAMSLKKRNCYLPQEKSLKYFKIYTKKNCEQECLSAMMVKACDCVPFYVISMNSAEITSFHNSDIFFKEAQIIKLAEFMIKLV